MWLSIRLDLDVISLARKNNNPIKYQRILKIICKIHEIIFKKNNNFNFYAFKKSCLRYDLRLQFLDKGI